MKKIPEKLKGYSLYEAIKRVLQLSVYDSLTEAEFEESWNSMISKYELDNNDWLAGLYEERRRWVPVFVKTVFWAGMSTTQRSESMNAFFDKYVNSKTTLKQFVEQYDNALRDKHEKENLADSDSFHSVRPCITDYQIEKQFQAAYTNSKFKEFQEELRRKLYCYPSLLSVVGSTYTYEVAEDMASGDHRRDIKFVVTFNEVECELHCVCCLFEFRGILCRHVLAVLTQWRVTAVLSKYILTRWRKDVRRKHMYVTSNCNDFSSKPQAQRFDRMCNKFYDIAEIGAESEDKCIIVMNALDGVMERVSKGETKSASSQPPREASTTIPSLGESRVLSPTAVRSKGRPPFKRKVSKVDEAIRKKKEGTSKARLKKPDMGGLSSDISAEDHLLFGLGTQDSVTPLPDLNVNQYGVAQPHFWPVQMNDSLLFGSQVRVDGVGDQHDFLYYSQP